MVRLMVEAETDMVRLMVEAETDMVRLMVEAETDMVRLMVEAETDMVRLMVEAETDMVLPVRRMTAGSGPYSLLARVVLAGVLDLLTLLPEHLVEALRLPDDDRIDNGAGSSAQRTASKPERSRGQRSERKGGKTAASGRTAKMADKNKAKGKMPSSGKAKGKAQAKRKSRQQPDDDGWRASAELRKHPFAVKALAVHGDVVVVRLARCVVVIRLDLAADYARAGRGLTVVDDAGNADDSSRRGSRSRTKSKSGKSKSTGKEASGESEPRSNRVIALLPKAASVAIVATGSAIVLTHASGEVSIWPIASLPPLDESGSASGLDLPRHDDYLLVAPPLPRMTDVAVAVVARPAETILVWWRGYNTLRRFAAPAPPVANNDDDSNEDSESDAGGKLLVARPDYVFPAPITSVASSPGSGRLTAVGLATGAVVVYDNEYGTERYVVTLKTGAVKHLLLLGSEYLVAALQRASELYLFSLARGCARTCVPLGHKLVTLSRIGATRMVLAHTRAATTSHYVALDPVAGHEVAALAIDPLWSPLRRLCAPYLDTSGAYAIVALRWTGEPPQPAPKLAVDDGAGEDSGSDTGDAAGGEGEDGEQAVDAAAGDKAKVEASPKSRLKRRLDMGTPDIRVVLNGASESGDDDDDDEGSGGISDDSLDLSRSRVARIGGKAADRHLLQVPRPQKRRRKRRQLKASGVGGSGGSGGSGRGRAGSIRGRRGGRPNGGVGGGVGVGGVDKHFSGGKDSEGSAGDDNGLDDDDHEVVDIDAGPRCTLALFSVAEVAVGRQADQVVAYKPAAAFASAAAVAAARDARAATPSASGYLRAPSSETAVVAISQLDEGRRSQALLSRAQMAAMDTSLTADDGLVPDAGAGGADPLAARSARQRVVQRVLSRSSSRTARRARSVARTQRTSAALARGSDELAAFIVAMDADGGLPAEWHAAAAAAEMAAAGPARSEAARRREMARAAASSRAARRR
ncbi:uncharacterized protein AMSG_10763 [Thecamonas trahens ATCC 50062]|uniref:Uncharacterized protein n=1 Tax=Thecamonas trahens ATCC 50062 TaxID=461836 RepID=A0A0L0DS50_THETB|nr:hypothetical protein AMSG_10763 [Thecamonas trahens ATCC 50062]KNC55154.1 hypothetical protein AMSG_10763 [Thecamonas trahens ATCC 50062]|eukprot:XP_013753209.1 hypothetical protein AMSG_10763 [Thecamonas trahens ATCC 50062]